MSNRWKLAKRAATQTTGVVSIVLLSYFISIPADLESLDELELETQKLLTFMFNFKTNYDSRVHQLDRSFFTAMNKLVSPPSDARKAKGYSKRKPIRKEDLVEFCQAFAPLKDVLPTDYQASTETTTGAGFFSIPGLPMPKHAYLDEATFDASSTNSCIVNALNFMALRDKRLDDSTDELAEVIVKFEEETEMLSVEQKDPEIHTIEDIGAKIAALVGTSLFISRLHRHWSITTLENASYLPSGFRGVRGAFKALGCVACALPLYLFAQQQLLDQKDEKDECAGRAPTKMSTTQFKWSTELDTKLTDGSVNSKELMQMQRQMQIMQDLQLEDGESWDDIFYDKVVKPKLRPGTNREDPFTINKAFSFMFVAPVYQSALFNFVVLRSFLYYLHPIQAHILTMVIATLMQDVNDDPALLPDSHEMDSTNAMLLTIVRNALSQACYQFSGSLVASCLFDIAVRWLAWTAAYAENSNILKELLPYYRYVMMPLMILSASKELGILELARSDKWSRSFNDKDCSAVMRSFSTGGQFSDAKTQKLSVDDTVDLIESFYHALETVGCKMPNSLKVGAIYTGFANILMSKHRGSVNYIECIKEAWRESRDSIIPVNITPETKQTLTKRTDAKDNDALSVLYMHQMLIAHVESMYPDGVTYDQLPDLLSRLNIHVPADKWAAILHEMTRWEDITPSSTEAFLDLLQSYYSDISNQNKKIVYDVREFMADKYWVRLHELFPLSGEEEAELNNTLSRHFYARQNRESVKYLLQHHGLTLHRFGSIIERYATCSKEVRELKEEWHAYFLSEKYHRKIAEMFFDRSTKEA